MELECPGELRFVEDGEKLINYLRRSGKYTDLMLAPRPALILLDLNMPRKDGWQVLEEIKSDPDLMDIPVAIWTTSKESGDGINHNKTGADVFITKPTNYAKLLNSLRELVATYCY